MTDELPAGFTRTVAAPTDDTFHYVCELDELELNDIRPADLEGRAVGIVRTVAGVFAIGTVCPHQGGPMCDGLIKGTMDPSPRNEYRFGHDGEIVTCPWHGYEFHLTTGESVGHALKGRIGAFPVEVRDGAVFVSSKRMRPAPRPREA